MYSVVVAEGSPHVETESRTCPKREGACIPLFVSVWLFMDIFLRSPQVRCVCAFPEIRPTYRKGEHTRQG